MNVNKKKKQQKVFIKVKVKHRQIKARKKRIQTTIIECRSFRKIVKIQQKFSR